jgi:acetylornithine/succinyldiaminopimelate/putrescine aminotransferase
MLASNEVSTAFQPRTHASTFGGNPLVCAASIAAIETLLEDGIILDQCNRMSRYLIESLNQLRHEYQGKVVDVRGKGLLVAMELLRDAVPYVSACMERGILVGLAGAGNILRFTPPLIVEGKDIDHMIDVLEDVLEKLP